MATNCFDKILCENAWECNITLLDADQNPINPLNLNNGDDVVFVLGDKPGYNFLGWRDENGDILYYETLGDNRYLIRSIDCSKKYLAKYCAISYTVSLSSNGSCFLGYDIHNVIYGQTVHIDAPESTTCRFLHWLKDGLVYTETKSFDYVVTGNVSFRAIYDNIAYRITAKPGKRNRGVCQGSGLYNLNQNIQISASANSGYYFEGWDDGNLNPTRTVTVRGNKTYVANFGVGQNIVVVTPTSGGSVLGSGNYATGSVVSLQAIPDPGWKFSHWYISGDRYEESAVSFVASRNVTATPYFTRGQYNIVLLPSPSNTGGFSPQPQGSYQYGDSFTVEAVPSNGYRFVMWEDGFMDSTREITVTGNATYTALFEILEETFVLTIILPDATYTCGIYVGNINVGTQNGNVVTTRVPKETYVSLSPSAQLGKYLSTIVDGGGNVIWTNDITDQSKSLIPYTVIEDSELTLNYQDIMYSVSVTASPINQTTSGNITLTANVGAAYDVFAPTATHPTRTFNNVTYNTPVTLIAPQTVGTYEFSYWSTELGSFTTTTVNIAATRTLNCVAVYK